MASNALPLGEGQKVVIVEAASFSPTKQVEGCPLTTDQIEIHRGIGDFRGRCVALCKQASADHACMQTGRACVMHGMDVTLPPIESLTGEHLPLVVLPDESDGSSVNESVYF